MESERSDIPLDATQLSPCDQTGLGNIAQPLRLGRTYSHAFRMISQAPEPALTARANSLAVSH